MGVVDRVVGCWAGCISWVDNRWIVKKVPFMFHYKSPKYLKVDVPSVALFYRFLQGLFFFLAMYVPLYYNDAWALKETPGGTINAWDTAGTMEEASSDRTLAARMPYCSSAEFSYSEGNQHLPSPACMPLLAGELTDKTTSSVFYTSAYMETVTRAWPCASDLAANGTRRAGCAAGGGFFFERRNGQCGCVTQSAVYPLAVEEMLLGFAHSYDTSLLGWSGWSTRKPKADDDAARNSAAADEAGVYSVLQLADGSSVRFEAGEPLEMRVADWLAAANVSLDARNLAVPVDGDGNLAPLRSTGVAVRVDIAYTNRDPLSGRAVIGARQVHADVSLRSEYSTWTGVAKQTTWVIAPQGYALARAPTNPGRALCSDALARAPTLD